MYIYICIGKYLVYMDASSEKKLQGKFIEIFIRSNLMVSKES